MYVLTKVSKSNQIVIPSEFRKKYNIKSGDKISWRNTSEGIFLKVEEKTTEEDIIGLIKEELPYNSVEIKKRGGRGQGW